MIGSATLHEGDTLLLVPGSAHRDERVFDAPDEFRIGRFPIFARLGLGELGLHRHLDAGPRTGLGRHPTHDNVVVGVFTRRRTAGTVPMASKEVMVDKLHKLRNAVTAELARANAERAVSPDIRNLSGIDKMLAWVTADLTPT